METLNWPQLRFHEMQAKLWTSKAKMVNVVAGRGSGKTELARRRLVCYLPVKTSWIDPRYFYAAPTYAQAKRVSWYQILDLIPKQWIKSVSLSELSIRTVFGSELIFIGLDKPQRIEGVQWDGGVVDESSDVKPGTFNRSILPALTWRDGWCWRIGVPKRFGIGAIEFREAWQNGLDTGCSFCWPSAEIVPKAALDYARANLDARDYAEQFDAKWQTAAGQIFHAFDKDINVRPCSYNSNACVIVSSDFNVDPMAWVIGHLKNDVLEIFDEIYLRDTNTTKTLNILAKRYADHTGGWRFFGDASGKARKTSAATSDLQQITEHDAFKKMGRTLHYLHSNPPIADRFAATNSRICSADGNRRVFIDPHCKNLIFDLESRGYKPGTREPDDTQDIGHMTDALGYVLYKLFPIRVRVESDKTYEIKITQ